MQLKELAKKQRAFDKKHFDFGWDDSDEGWLEGLQHCTIALAGESGEFSNVIKKLLLKKKLTGKIDKALLKQAREELTDTFIYTLVLSERFLKMDLEKEYLKKHNRNIKRFAHQRGR